MKIKTQKQTFIDFLKRCNVPYDEEESAPIYEAAFAPEDVVTAKGFKFHFLCNQSQKMTLIQNDEPFNLPQTQEKAKKSREFEECARILLEYDSWEPKFKGRTNHFYNKYGEIYFDYCESWLFILHGEKSGIFYSTLTDAKKAFCEWLVSEVSNENF